jgi:hypothetical protein
MNLAAFLDKLASQEAMLGLLLVCLGLAFMLMGFRIFRAIVAISFGAVGFGLGATIPAGPVLQAVLSLAGAVGLAIISVLFVRIAISLLAGGWAAMVFSQLAYDLDWGGYWIWIFAAIVGMGVISLSLIMYQELIAFITSFEGALLLTAGLVILCAQMTSFWSTFRTILATSPIFSFFLILAITVSGFYFQATDIRQKQTGMSG